MNVATPKCAKETQKEIKWSNLVERKTKNTVNEQSRPPKISTDEISEFNLQFAYSINKKLKQVDFIRFHIEFSQFIGVSSITN